AALTDAAARLSAVATNPITLTQVSAGPVSTTQATTQLGTVTVDSSLLTQSATQLSVASVQPSQVLSLLR
ncbi:hypothetical protein ACX9NJ_21645, partial [Mycobacterium sp. ML2]